MANVEGNSNVQMTKRDRRLLGNSDFVIVSSFIIRISSYQPTAEQEQEYEQEFGPAEIRFRL
jgi:hypothetical protein